MSRQDLSGTAAARGSALGRARVRLPHALEVVEARIATGDVDAELARIHAPTLLIHGAADPLMPLGAAEALQAAVPQARLQAIPACAHAPFMSRPDDFLSACRTFLHE